MRFWFIGFAFIIFACAGSREAIKEEDSVKQTPYIESFDPLSLNDNDIVVVPPEEETTEQIKNSAKQNKEPRVSEISGFRVQILATNNLEKASLVEQEASERFNRSGYSTYLVFEAPLYKVRIGDCTDRSQAEKIRDLAKSVGYDGAFIVKSMVNAPH